MGTVEQELLAAQNKAAALFDEVVARGLIKPGVYESELSQQIHALAKSNYGVKRHWHERIVRAGPNTLLDYSMKSPDRQIMADDTVFLDFGPVFDGWEADYARTYVVGNDPRKHQLVADLKSTFMKGKQLFRDTPTLTSGELYDYVFNLGLQAGWQFGADSAGHLVGHFPHEPDRETPSRLQINHGNTISLREPDAQGATRHWILEVHFVDRVNNFGGFVEELLTV